MLVLSKSVDPSKYEEKLEIFVTYMNYRVELDQFANKVHT